MERGQGRPGGVLTPTAQSNPGVNTEGGESSGSGSGPAVRYVDRVVQEILDTERTYVQDLRSIVQVSHTVPAQHSNSTNAVFEYWVM